MGALKFLPLVVGILLEQHSKYWGSFLALAVSKDIFVEADIFFRVTYSFLNKMATV
jgi:hypothetical protein